MIFNLFKSKPTLKELIPNGFIDIHSHILPGIDDGAKNIEESIKIIQGMREMGFVKAIATPHTYPGLYNNTKNSIKKSFDKLNKIKIDGIKLEYASEYMIGNYFLPLIQEKKLLCLKDNFVLIEMNYLSLPENIYSIIFELKVNNYIPILAHPERYVYLQNNFKEFIKLKKFGCLFQMNLLSVNGTYGKLVNSISEKLLKNNLVDFVGSDIHSQRHILAFDKKIKIKKIKNLELAIDANKIFI